MTTAQELAGKMGLRRCAGGYSGPCPACGYKTGLRLSEKAGRVLWWCAACQDQAAVTAAILGDAPAAPPRDAAPPERSNKNAWRYLWEAGLPPGPVVSNYLASRALRLPEAAPLRFLPDAKHPSGRRLPAMLALLTDAAGQPVAVHRTFLAPGGTGKAAVDPVRMTLGPVRGAAVRLHGAGNRLLVAEGIETALAASIILRVPAWAAVSAGNMANDLALPPAVREVIVAGDNDAPGLAAAKKAVARFRAEGRQARLAVPDKPDTDFNDLLQERRLHG